MKEFLSLAENKEQYDVDVKVMNGYNSSEFLLYKNDIQKIQAEGEFLDFDSMDGNSFSCIDSSDKFTKRLCDCTGVVLFGKRKGADDFVSLVSHTDVITEAMKNMDPGMMAKLKLYKEKEKARLGELVEKIKKDIDNSSDEEEIEIYDDDLEMDVSRNKATYLKEELENALHDIENLDHDMSADEYVAFEKELDDKLSSFAEIVDRKTITGTIIGGQVLEKSEVDSEEENFSTEEIGLEKERYDRSINFWKERVSKYFGTEPSVAYPPLATRQKKHGMDIFIDTQKRRILAVSRSE